MILEISYFLTPKGTTNTSRYDVELLNKIQIGQRTVIVFGKLPSFKSAWYAFGSALKIGRAFLVKSDPFAQFKKMKIAAKFLYGGVVYSFIEKDKSDLLHACWM